ncbi:hypothetical protein HELRODRAFT_165922 [Helobdella robusta]|uniref:Uncharacterized protein n=1 Tax=Helobdella robusta TaxID=6412 RepID=T1EXG6_HELRO|nr:hypothetical protein HELRODRAFT_165922 [Helobdella robusta]ESN90279.1 hypothetical protein HELRODRAFT_165922 [Helobdella robusta]
MGVLLNSAYLLDMSINQPHVSTTIRNSDGGVDVRRDDERTCRDGLNVGRRSQLNGSRTDWQHVNYVVCTGFPLFQILYIVLQNRMNKFYVNSAYLLRSVAVAHFPAVLRLSNFAGKVDRKDEMDEVGKMDEMEEVGKHECSNVTSNRWANHNFSNDNNFFANAKQCRVLQCNFRPLSDVMLRFPLLFMLRTSNEKLFSSETTTEKFNEKLLYKKKVNNHFITAGEQLSGVEAAHAVAE